MTHPQPQPQPLPLIRSKLFVPGARPELFAKALASDTDAISIDLEDAVLEERKDEAREALTRFLQSDAASGHGKTIIVRINGLQTPHFERDIEACAWPAVDVINLPKAESADDVRRTAQAMARWEQAHGCTRPIGILANIESPRGLRLAAEIAGADARVVGLQHQRLQRGQALGLLQVQHQAALAAVHAQEGAALLRQRGGILVQRVAGRRHDHDHIGAQIGQQGAAVGTGDIARQVQHADARQRAGHVGAWLV
jgi:citrate lyase subunit beta/citryl-CoA lyase